jgi:hypothetical protein
MEGAIIQAAAQVHVSAAQARQWFLDLETHPERYRFETHTGFAFTRGGFGQVGARFQTWEQFHGLRINLHFEMTETSDAHFQFRLLRPRLPIRCAFTVEKIADDISNLCLTVGGTTSTGVWLLRLPLVRGAIQKQIQSEVNHIKASMETAHDLTRP